MTDANRVRNFYHDHPEMVSSPFGGVDSYRFDLLESVWDDLGFPVCVSGRILEVGCGRAWLRPRLAGQGWKYTGLDLLIPEGLGAEAAGPNSLGDTLHLPFPENTFGALVCIDAYEHFPDETMAVREFHRVLQPGGEVFLSTPNYANVAGVVKWWMESFGKYEKESWAPFGGWTPQAFERPVTISSVRKTFQAVGFREGKCVGFAEDLHLGLCPWAAHSRFPESLLYRLQSCLPRTRRFLSSKVPTLSLHQFWRWKK